MYKRILVALDGGFMTDKVLAEAVALAKQNGAILAVCYALDETILPHVNAASMLATKDKDEVEADLRAAGEKFLAEQVAKAMQQGVSAEAKLVESELKHVSDMLVDVATEWQADLLVVGTHGRRGLERFFVGSVAERLVRKAATSLLLVRGE